MHEIIMILHSLHSLVYSVPNYIHICFLGSRVPSYKVINQHIYNSFIWLYFLYEISLHTSIFSSLFFIFVVIDVFPVTEEPRYLRQYRQQPHLLLLHRRLSVFKCFSISKYFLYFLYSSYC